MFSPSSSVCPAPLQGGQAGLGFQDPGSTQGLSEDSVLWPPGSLNPWMGHRNQVLAHAPATHHHLHLHGWSSRLKAGAPRRPQTPCPSHERLSGPRVPASLQLSGVSNTWLWVTGERPSPLPPSAPCSTGAGKHRLCLFPLPLKLRPPLQ